MTFNLKEKEVQKVSYRTGKLLKIPKIRWNWIDLTEIIEAQNITHAVQLAKGSAIAQEWQLVSVEELQ